jgi:hypothetical protein
MWKAILLGALIACGGADVSRLLGAQCDVTAECDDRCLAPGNDYPDGFCTLDCSSNAECPEDSDCVDLEGGVCLFTCNVAEDCVFLGPGWTCREENLREDQNARSRICAGS